MRRLAALLLLPLAAAACGDPPEREFHQAQGAIEAARAAGAEAYAPEELAQAEQALARYDEAVAQRDFRQALNHALDARERASAAARQAAAAKAIRRGEIERRLVELAADAERGRVALARATRAQVAAARTLRQVIADTERALQEARAALERDDLTRAHELVDGLQPRLTQALAPFSTSAGPAAPRRR